MFSFRLELYDRNSNFGRSLMELEYNMDLPTVDCYKDLNADADVPKFSSDNVAAYLATYDKTVDKISIDMYNDGYINYIRYASKDQLVFFKAECRAQMKAKISYTVDYLELVSDELKLKMTHDYFYQVQGQMLCTGASHVDFVIYTFVDIKVLRISRADDFITDMVAKLQVFYDKYFRQALIENTFAKDYFDCIACHCSKQ